MTKRAGTVSKETKEKILTAARDEFLLYGFQGSSLRRICSEANVTTGAIYFFFTGKDDLFESVISQVTSPFIQLIKEHYDFEHSSQNRNSKDSEDADYTISKLLIELYFHNQKIWDIVIHQLHHPAVQCFLDQFVEISMKHYTWLLKDSKKDEFAIHQYIHMQIDAMINLISHDFSQEEMIRHSKAVIRMLRGAFCALMNE